MTSPALRPSSRPSTTSRHHTGKKNSVRIPASSGSVRNSHLTKPMGANNPTAPPSSVGSVRPSFWAVIVGYPDCDLASGRPLVVPSALAAPAFEHVDDGARAG